MAVYSTNQLTDRELAEDSHNDALACPIAGAS
jgi:hypothetical protein